MKRGEIWTIAGGSDYAGKPRPAAIVQSDNFNATKSILVCAFTSFEDDAPIFRILVMPNETNGLAVPSRLMVDTITSLPRDRLGRRIGRLDDTDLLRLNRAMLVFLGLAG